MGPSSAARNAMVNAASVPAQNPILKRTAQAAFEGAYFLNFKAFARAPISSINQQSRLLQAWRPMILMESCYPRIYQQMCY